MVNLTVYLLENSDSQSVDRHLVYPDKLRRMCTSLLTSQMISGAGPDPPLEAAAHGGDQLGGQLEVLRVGSHAAVVELGAVLGYRHRGSE
jgi:hypothetical protein